MPEYPTMATEKENIARPQIGNHILHSFALVIERIEGPKTNKLGDHFRRHLQEPRKLSIKINT